ncbi:hypothetical protein McanMca71_006981 [Microsporum canis]|uniref:Uncharacterized protein n=1 Tax=Arthroderma otae (strain ATCC MYA-4605 / CBS 113480) TaxID=554155 RepID=C5FBK7_ARTOC|nr:uncharacterized protein MCYG_00079 [Microsporum canis CBS 113480]EEQ27191.1 predicted protein [Microsporum canis CBS 113480]
MAETLLEAVSNKAGLRKIRRLVEDGCDITAQDPFGKTALHCALELQHGDVCEYLVGKMAEQGRRLSARLPQAVTSWAREERWFPALESVVPVRDGSTSLTRDGYLALLEFLAESLGLPETIVAKILDDAEFWVTDAARREDEIYIDEDMRVKPYIKLRSTALQGYLRRIDIVTVSHDQGWSSEGIHNSYMGSYTWFDLGVIRHGEEEEEEEEEEDDYCYCFYGEFEDDEEDDDEDDEDEGEYEGEGEAEEEGKKKDILELQSNVCASDKRRTHYNEIRPRAPAIADWMDSIKPGDCIAVYPRAKYNAWVNYVKCVEIKLWYAQWHI